jgi:hypothetical protein
LLVIEDRAVTEAMSFSRTEEAMTHAGSVRRRGKVMDGARKIILGFKVMDKVVHIIIVRIVTINKRSNNSLELTNRTNVGFFGRETAITGPSGL